MRNTREVTLNAQLMTCHMSAVICSTRWQLFPHIR